MSAYKNEYLAGIAKDTLNIIKKGATKNFNIRDELEYSMFNSILYTPDYFNTELKFRAKSIRLINKSVLDVNKELVLDVDKKVSCLNFASGNSACGGWLNGAMAQEEAMAYASGLYATQLQHPEYYEANKKEYGFFTDHIIYSPKVPFFKNTKHEILDKLYCVDIITAPAVKATAINSLSDKDKIAPIMDKRINNVLRVMHETNANTIVLGAWGAGAYGCDGIMIAEAFNKQLKNQDEDALEFDEAVFAIYDRTNKLFSIFEDILINNKKVEKKKPAFTPTRH